MSNKLKTYVNSLSALERAELLKKTSIAVLSLTKQYKKSIAAQGNAHINTSRARRSTLIANSSKIAALLSSTIDDVKIIALHI